LPANPRGLVLFGLVRDENLRTAQDDTTLRLVKCRERIACVPPALRLFTAMIEWEAYADYSNS